jgi:Xaa-Pro aminopeptidase
MKRDLDALMQASNIDALLVFGNSFHNPAMVYLTGGGHITHAMLVKRRGETAVLFHGPMERDEAAKTGLQTRSYSNYPFKDFITEAKGDFETAMALRGVKMFTDLGLTRGRVAVYGQAELGPVVALLDALKARLPELEFVGFNRDPLLLRAMQTKDADEVARIRRMGQVTTKVVGMVADFLTRHPVQNETLIKADGTPLTIEDVKGKINLWLAENGAENPEATIFAIGRDGGVPHSSGTPSDPIRLGQPIVFDIFPCEAGGGYFYDFTRTWCLGYAPPAVQHLYDQVKVVYDQLVSELKVDAHFGEYQARTCEMFEEMGHPTVGSDPSTEVGYVHSLGHGVGLNIHEKPFSGSNAEPTDTLAPGAVFTLEPGLYYPDRGMGVRIEDTYWITPDGKFERLADFPVDLILPMQT